MHVTLISGKHLITYILQLQYVKMLVKIISNRISKYPALQDPRSIGKSQNFLWLHTDMGSDEKIGTLYCSSTQSVMMELQPLAYKQTRPQTPDHTQCFFVRVLTAAGAADRLKYSLVDAGLEAYLPTRSAYKAWCSHVLQIVIALRTGHAADRSIEKILSSEAPIANDWINGVSAGFFFWY